MLRMFTLTGRLLRDCWPTLLAWLAATQLIKYGLIQLAALISPYTSLGGACVLALGVFSALLGYVAMFRILADQLSLLEGAALPTTARERRTAFMASTLTAIIPYLVIYISSGQMVDDVKLFSDYAIHAQIRLSESSDGDFTTIPVTALSVSVVVAAFVGRWLYKRFQKRLPVWCAAVAAYLETLWFFLAALMVGSAQESFVSWLEQRQGMVWLADFRTWMADQFSWLLAGWDGLLWLVGLVIGVVALPLAWLATAGAVMQRGYNATALDWGKERWDRSAAGRRAKGRWAGLSDEAKTRATDVRDMAVGRFAPIVKALTLMVRSGPAMIGVFVLGYVLVDGLGKWVWMGLTRMVGPVEVQTAAVVFAVASAGALLITEPLRVSYLAASAQAVRDSVNRQTAPAPEAELSAEAAASATPAGSRRVGELQGEGDVATLQRDVGGDDGNVQPHVR